MSKRNDHGAITGWLAFALIPVAVPIILILKLFGIGNTVKRTPDEVAGYIRDFIENTGGKWDWDDFTSVTIEEPELESLRAEICNIPLPIDSAGISKLKELLAKAEALQLIAEKQKLPNIDSVRT